MTQRFTRAIVRPPPGNFANGLTTVDLGVPDFALALDQHAAYCEALASCGLALTSLDPDPRYPDSAFAEDTAVLAHRVGIVTRPGDPTRQGEETEIRAALSPYFVALRNIKEPGTVDGGDICHADSHFFIGISKRTNPEGARQLAEILTARGYTAVEIDIRETPGILHLKSGISYLGDRRLVAIDSLAAHPAFREFQRIPVAREEEYAANCVRVNDFVLAPCGYPKTLAALAALGYCVIQLEMSEFQKMDGGLSCLSLRF